MNFFLRTYFITAAVFVYPCMCVCHCVYICVVLCLYLACTHMSKDCVWLCAVLEITTGHFLFSDKFYYLLTETTMLFSYYHCYIYPCMCVFSVARNWLLAIFWPIILFSWPKSILVGPNLSIGNQSNTLVDKLLIFIYTTSLCAFCAFPCMCVYVHTYMHAFVCTCVCVCITSNCIIILPIP